MALLEYVTTGHWDKRKKERLDDFYDLILPDDFFKPNDNRSQIVSLMSQAIKDAITKKLTKFTQGTDNDSDKYNTTTIAEIFLLRNGITYKPTIKARSINKKGIVKENEGSVYVAISKHNRLLTLLLLTSEQNNPGRLATDTIDHVAREYEQIITTDDIIIKDFEKPDLKLAADVIIDKALKPVEPIVPKRITPESLPYKIRADYRKSSKSTPSYFEIKDKSGKWKRGEIVSTEPEMFSSGKWDKIEVLFPGALKPEIFKNLFTTTYFSRRENKINQYLRLLEQLTKRKIKLI